MLPIKRFMGKIDGKDIYYFSRLLDYALKQKERVEHLNKILYNNGKLDKYFEEVFIQRDIVNGIDTSHIKLCLDKTGFLSSDINVCREIEKMADYVLFSPDGERITKKTIYNFYPKEIFEQKIRKEEKISAFGALEDEQRNEDVIDFLIREGENYKKQIQQKITFKDLNDVALSVLKEYEKFINKLRNMLSAKGDSLSFSEKKKLRQMISSLIDDEIHVKDKVKGTIYFKQVLKDSTVVDYNQFDFTNKNHVLALLKVPKRTDLNEDLACLIFDLESLIKNTNLTHLEKQVLKLWRLEDETQESIAVHLGVTQPYISKILNSIATKIGNQYTKEYIDWYYLEVEKGTYKKCSECGEVKLIAEFNKDSKSRDGYKNICKTCRKKNNSK